MKKALICTALAGFIRSFLKNDICILRNMGYEIHCAANIHHNGAEGMMDFFADNNISFHQIDFSSNKPISKDTFESYFQIKRLLKENDFDFVHVHTPIAGAIVRQICKKYRKQGLIVAYTTHGFYFHKRSSRKNYLIFHTIESCMSKYSDAIITINHEDYENAKKMHCHNVYYIPGVGVDTKKFVDTIIDRDEYRRSIGIDADTLMILAVGELSKRKNHRVIIEAISMLQGREKIAFVICGNAMNSDNTKDELVSIANEKGVKLILLGLRQDIPQICKCADIGVIPSLREGLGLAGIEMLASGLPVIGSDSHGIVDYIKNGVNGYLCEPNDAKAFSQAISRLLLKSDREKMKESCIESSFPFDKANSENSMKEIYYSILKKGDK